MVKRDDIGGFGDEMGRQKKARKDFMDDLKQAGDDRRDRAREEGGRRALFVADIKGEVAGMARETARMMENFRTEREQRAQADRQERNVFTADLVQGVSDMISQFRQTLDESAQAGRGERAAFIRDLRSEVAEMARDTTQLMADFHSQLEGMSRAEREERIAFVSELGQMVQTFLSGVNNAIANAVDFRAGPVTKADGFRQAGGRDAPRKERRDTGTQAAAAKKTPAPKGQKKQAAGGKASGKRKKQDG